MGYQKIYRFFSEECLKKKRKGKGKCKYHGGELEGEFRFIENFIVKMNPLQFQVTTTATRTHICSEAGKQKWTELTWDMSNANYRGGAHRHDIQETGLPTQVKYMKRQTR